MIELKDPYTRGHADRVSFYAEKLGLAMKLTQSEVDTLHKGAFLHDVGKIAIPDSVLTKPGRYTPEEYGIMKQHAILGYHICEKIPEVADALSLIRHHHERLDGSGYPDGLFQDQISALVRTVSIVDVYDALRSKRSYKEAFTIDQTFQIMWEEANKGWWDKDILRTWERLVRAQPLDRSPQ